jgi:hypothetical protein
LSRLEGQKKAVSTESDKGSRSGIGEFLEQVMWYFLAPIAMIAMVAIGVFVYGQFPQFGYLGAGIISLVAVIGIALLLRELLVRMIGRLQNRSPGPAEEN